MSTAAFVLSVVAFAISTWLAVQRLRTSKNANALPVAIDLLREFRSDDFKRRQERVYEHMQANEPTDEGIWGLPPDARNDTLFLSHFYDNVGLLVATGAADERPLLAYLGGSAEKTWRSIHEFLVAERKRRRAPYQMFFEDFVDRAQERTAIRLRDDMRLRRIDQDPWRSDGDMPATKDAKD